MLGIMKYIADDIGRNAKPDEDGLFNYVELLRSHILKEEAILFPMADQILNSGTQAELADRFNMIEVEVIGRGKHEEYHKRLETLSQKYHR